MQQFNTGYKSEFGLGAALAGENDAFTDQANQLELIKNFLANQREQKMQPLDVDIKGLQAAQARSQNTPEMLQAFVDNTRAGYNKNIREDELGTLLQPFRKQAAPMQGQAEVAQAINNSNLLELQKTIDTGMDMNNTPISPQDMQILQQELQKQIAMRGQTPELYGKMQIEDKKGQWDMEKQRLANEGHLASVNAGADKTNRMEVVKAFSTITSQLNNINSNLAKIETKEIENQWISEFIAQGKDKKTAEAMAKQQKSQLKAQFLQEKQMLQEQQRYILTQIPGLKTMPTQPQQGTSAAPIKLD